ncbi:immunoglobulin-like domain-containing protein [Listeria booriae]|uniref:immunoglobulin-like domain-containing protein n=1 Tax=Listeria booriae TaxID=1552123 RepID=UPI001623EAF5|nr:immunoglobulin-like domain-containing protein [Listeria booriae]MBC2388962.1 DUF5011 domain-containing protein [Listeria booriae]
MKRGIFLKLSLIVTMTLSPLTSAVDDLIHSETKSTAHAESVLTAVAPKAPLSVVNIINGSFENPTVAGPWQAFLTSQIPGWKTTSTDNQIEFQTSLITPPADGNQYIELNGYQVAAAYQDITTTPGTTIRWQASHRGRYGVDTAAVKFGAPTGTLTQQATMTTGNNAWQTYSGSYIVPAGQTSTRFQFQSISSSDGSLTAGNLLDNVILTSQSFLTVAATGPATVKQNKTGTYQFQVKNEGGMESQASTLRVPIPEGMTLTGTVTVNGSQVTGNYDSASRILSIPLDNITKDATKTVNVTLGGQTMTDNLSIQATVTHQDKGYTDTTYTNYSNEIKTNIIANHPPTINATDSELILGDTFNPLQNVTATDVEDGDLTEAVTVTANNVNMEVPGIYQVRYSVTDSDGNTVTAQVTIRVKSQDPPVITGANPVRLNPNSEFDPMSTVTATDREDGDLTNRIRITSNDVTTAIPGTYHITYEVTDSDQMTATWTQTVVVTEAPIIIGETAITINLHDTFDPISTVHATDKEDGNLTNQIVLTGTVDSNQSGNYDLTYTVTDSDGNTTTLRQTVTVFDNTIFQFNEAPEDLLFETTEIRSEDITINRQNPDWNIQVKDTRNNGSPWALTATVNGAFSDQEDPNAKQLHNAITYTVGTEETVLLDNQAFVIHEGISDQNEITTIRAPADQGLRMKVNPTGVKANHDYKTSITWTLNDTP